MLSLRNFHLGFILLAIVGADLFGVWAVRHHLLVGDRMILSLGVLAIVGGLGLIGYAIKLVRSMDRSGIG